MVIIADGVADEVFDLPVTSKPAVSREKVINGFAGLTQFLTWPLLFVIFHVCFSMKISGRENFRRARGPFIIVSNHIDSYHSFLFRLVLGYFTPHLPLRFMAVNRFDWPFLNFLARIGFIDFLYSLFGVFTITPGLGLEKNIKKAIEIIKVGGNIVIYPEGRITREGGIGPFKSGAAAIMQATQVDIMPVSFRITGRGWLRKKLEVHIGGPFCMIPGRSLEEITNSLRKRVVELWEGV
jgi:1-acyl-sn-glycerol-3-phosphate acyltransferase